MTHRPTVEALEDRVVLSPGQFIPGQFIAKMYTEALGRTPNPPTDPGWNSWVTYFNNAMGTCASLTNGVYSQLDGMARSVYGDAHGGGLEYNSLNYRNGEKVLTLYRGILNREPDPNGFGAWLTNLNNGMTIQAAVDAFFNPTYTPEIQPLVNRICTPSSTDMPGQWPHNFGPSYGFGYAQPIDLTTRPIPLDPVFIMQQYGPQYHTFTGYGPQGLDKYDPTNRDQAYCTQSTYNCYNELQALLTDRGNTFAQTGVTSVVLLPPELVVRLNGTLSIPSGVGMWTFGTGTSTGTSHNYYAEFARFVRDADPTGVGSFRGPLVYVSDNANLYWVWIDGERGHWAFYGANNYQEPTSGLIDTWGYSRDALNLETARGTAGSTIDNIVSSNTTGAASMTAGLPEDMNVSCGNKYITSNLVTDYTSGQVLPPMSNETVPQADGINTWCEGTFIQNDAQSSVGNEIVDASDFALIMYRVQGDVNIFPYGRPQASHIHGNYILNAGNSANAGIGVDPLFNQGLPQPQWDFSGSMVDHNSIWTANGYPNYFGATVPDIHIALAIGTLAYFNQSMVTSLPGFGTYFAYNNIPSGTVLNATYFIGLSGMKLGPSGQVGATIVSNVDPGGGFRLVNNTTCQPASASVNSAGYFDLGTGTPPHTYMNGLWASYSAPGTQMLDDKPIVDCAIGP
jgi:hypothetical protein